jgi:translocator protein
MNMIASTDQLRGTFIRWSLLFVPSFVLFGMLSAQLSGSGPVDPWFAGLAKPASYPPPAVFGLVWTMLYALMGFSLAVVASARGASGRGSATLAFFVQLAINLAWSPVFFGAHQITGGLIMIALLDVAVVVTILLFRRVRPVAAMLLLPYLAWILFATFLTWEFREANPEMDGGDYPSTTTRIQI